MSIPPFKYASLHQDAPSFRLIKVLRGGGQSPLKCNFRVAYLDHVEEEYDAVSYAWGKMVRNRPIVIGDQRFLVSAIVEDILMRLRDPQRDRFLWLDLICIDQDNNDERRLQVNRMKDIFGKAQSVIVSLGPHIGTAHRTSIRSIPPDWYDGPDPPPPVRKQYKVDANGLLFISTLPPSQPSPHAIQVRTTDSYLDTSKQTRFDHALKLMTSTWGAVGSLANVPLSKVDEENMLELLRKPWFTRVWVIQEVAVAKKLTIICGARTMDGTEFAKSLHRRILARVRSDGLRTRLTLLRPLLAYMATESANKPTEELLTLLHRFRSWEATNPRDKVYALLGLGADSNDSGELQPDYNLPVAQLYQNVAEYMLSRYNSPSVLTYAMPKREPQAAPAEPEGWVSWLWHQFQPPEIVRNVREIPSWCPDWRENYSYPVPPDPNLDPDDSYRSTSPRLGSVYRQPYFLGAASHGTRTRSFSGWSIDSGPLKASGYILGKVTSILDDGSVEAIPFDDVKSVIEWPYTRVSRHLETLSAALRQVGLGGLKIEDRLCLLQGATGLAVLRPHEGQFHLVFLEHSNFRPFTLDQSFWLIAHRRVIIDAQLYQRTVFADIVALLVSKDGFKPSCVGQDLKSRTFELV
jgi:hypothetical protein